MANADTSTILYLFLCFFVAHSNTLPVESGSINEAVKPTTTTELQTVSARNSILKSNESVTIYKTTTNVGVDSASEGNEELAPGTIENGKSDVTENEQGNKKINTVTGNATDLSNDMGVPQKAAENGGKILVDAEKDSDTLKNLTKEKSNTPILETYVQDEKTDQGEEVASSSKLSNAEIGAGSEFEVSEKSSALATNHNTSKVEKQDIFDGASTLSTVSTTTESTSSTGTYTTTQSSSSSFTTTTSPLTKTSSPSMTTSTFSTTLSTSGKTTGTTSGTTTTWTRTMSTSTSSGIQEKVAINGAATSTTSSFLARWQSDLDNSNDEEDDDDYKNDAAEKSSNWNLFNDAEDESLLPVDDEDDNDDAGDVENDDGEDAEGDDDDAEVNGEDDGDGDGDDAGDGGDDGDGDDAEGDEPDVNDVVVDKFGDFWDERAFNQRPYIKEGLVTVDPNQQEMKMEKEISMITYYSWILFFTFLVFTLFLFFKQRHMINAYWTRINHSSRTRHPSNSEEGKSLMKNIYA